MKSLLIIFVLVGIFACKPDNNIQSQEIQKAVVQVADPSISNNNNMSPSNLGKDDVLGKIEYPNSNNFVKVDPKYSNSSNRYMHKEAYQAFSKMYEAAKKDGIDLKIISAARNFNYQKGIWERKWTGETTLSNGINLGKSDKSDVWKAQQILLYSSMPGTSRHHWGTDIDLNSFNNDYFAKGEGLKVYEWLQNNAEQFGFCQVYTAKDENRPFGYEEEKWHWSYIPVAKLYLHQAKSILSYSDIEGFLGSQTAESLHVIEHYILGINQNCNHGVDPE